MEDKDDQKGQGSHVLIEHNGTPNLSLQNQPKKGNL
jgi:hypothetical protein